MESPFQSILHTNSIPSDDERRRIHDLLAALRTEVDQITQDIDRMQRKRDELSDFMDAHLALLSQARRMPDDIIQEIFKASLPAHRPPTLSVDDAPLILFRISQRWRSLALSTPYLWASLHLIPPPTPVGVETSRLNQVNDTVKHWLLRSGSLPLTISFVGRHSSSGASEGSEQDHDLDQGAFNASKTLLQTLIQFASRWRCFRFVATPCVDLEPLEALSHGDVPMLRCVAIEGINFIDGLPLLATPTLTSLLARGTNLLFSTPIHWEVLCHIQLGHYDPSPQALLNALSQCSQLKSCILSVYLHDEDGNEPSCHLDQLQFLSIENRGSSSPTMTFLNCLRMPNLSFLKYSDQAAGANSLPIVPIFRSSPLLRCLILHVSTMLQDTLLEVLTLATKLEDLTIGGEPMTPGWPPAYCSVVEALTSNISGSGGILCPNLRSLTISDFRHLSDEALVQFVLARTDPERDTARLEQLKAYFARPPQIDIAIPLQQHVEDGFRLRLLYLPPPPTFPSYSAQEGNSYYDEWDQSLVTWGNQYYDRDGNLMPY
ncbi:hypothetical protein FB45DRAFT_924205 [Roridomyces roridus]|uniref:F-box domain-containing protein n=1 Tax=Roridomyces roridus TaxID=1738132 RepID=A0AAD7BLM4_9AGAR|nr:hypothetical protein FB45DRAFT_924205 [Roridomyces roridus]